MFSPVFSPERSELPLTVQPEWEQSVPTLVCRGQRASPLYDDVSLQRVSCPSPTQTLKLLAALLARRPPRDEVV